MGKDVIITIKSEKNVDGSIEPGPEFITDGNYEYGADGIRFSYLECAVSGVPGTQTDFLILPQEVVLLRRGSVGTRMVFRAGERNEFMVWTAYGALRMGVDTRRLLCSMGETGGNMEIEYDLNFDRSFVGRNLFQINVREKVG